MLTEHLNQNVFDADVETVTNRVGFGDGLKEAGQKNDRVVALAADLTGSTKVGVFAEAFPERFVQVGVAEQNMASVASGMAAMGKIPFIASYAMFSPGRSWEQVRTTIAYNESNVKIVGAHAGISVGPDGATHQAIEDVAIMRVVPGMVVLAPCDTHEAKRMILWAAEHEGPVYVRLAREPVPVITTPESPFVFGKSEVYFKRDQAHQKTVGIISSGTILHNALVAAKQLNEEHGVGASVMNLATIKPLDTEGIDAFAAEHDVIVTVEEHQVAGGMGSCVAEYLSGSNPKRVVRIGVEDQFGQSGTMEELYNCYGLDSGSIIERVLGVV